MNYRIHSMDDSYRELYGVTDIVREDGFITFLDIKNNVVIASFNQINVSHFVNIRNQNEKN